MPLNHFFKSSAVSHQMGLREVHCVNGANPPLTTILTATSIAHMGGRDSVQTRQWVNSALGLHHRRLRGTVHLWQYSDGSVRYTFQPAPPLSFHLAS